MESVFEKYEKKFGVTRRELRRMISSALMEENYEERLVDIFGVDNIEDVLFVCTNFMKQREQGFLRYEELEFLKYQENKFETIPSRSMYDESSVPVAQVKDGSKYFRFPFFNRVQSATFDAIYCSDDNVLVSAPTGSGKTEIAVLGILRAKAQGAKRIVYIAPMKALATEIVQKLEKIMGERICEFTGDTEISGKDARRYSIFVSTPEKFEVVTRRHRNLFEDSLRLLIIDEIHLLQDERGAILESIVCRIFRYIEVKQRAIRIVGISATLPNVEDVASFIKAKRLFRFDETYRPVSLDVSLLGVYGDRRKDGRRSETAAPHHILDICLEKIEEMIAAGCQVLLFTHSRPDTVATAKHVARSLEVGRQKRLFESGLFNELVSKGVGVHHAGLPRHVRHAMEKLFLEKLVRVLVCTSTLAWGVNLPANAVIIKGTTYYDAQRCKFADISILDVIQIFGRAGRPQFDKTGRAILITSKDKLDTFTKLLTDKRPIESQLLNSVVDLLNAEISLGHVWSVEEGHQWLKDTFLYLRMCKNPRLYGVSDENENIGDVLRDYVILSVKRLSKFGMVGVKAGSVAHEYASWRFVGTEIGRIASFYYVCHETIALWLQQLPSVQNERSLLLTLLASKEFSNIVYRIEEEETLKDLASDFGIEFEETCAVKMLVLVVAAFKRAKVYSFSLVCDQSYITHNLKRLLQAAACMLIEMRLFSLLPATCNFQTQIRQLMRESAQASYKMTFYSAGSLLHVQIVRETVQEMEHNNSGPVYAIFMAKGKILDARMFSGDANFFVPLPEEHFSIEIRGMQRNWAFEQEVSLADIKTLPCLEELYRYGCHRCISTHWTIGSGMQPCIHFKLCKERNVSENVYNTPCINSIEQVASSWKTCKAFVYFTERMFRKASADIEFEVISDHKDEEICMRIFNLIADSTSTVVVVVSNSADKLRTTEFLRKQCILKSCSFGTEHGHGVCVDRISNSGRVTVATLEKALEIREKHRFVFKRCRLENTIYPVVQISRIALRCPVTIFEQRDFCDLVRRALVLEC
eukprot:jgi/Antlo1/1863/2302